MSHFRQSRGMGYIERCKEQDESPATELNETEISDLPDKEFKQAIPSILNKVLNRVRLPTEMGNIKYSQ